MSNGLIKKKTVHKFFLPKNDKKSVLLATAIVNCYDKNGAIVKLRALIDQCGQASLITERGAQLLHATKKHIQSPIKAVGDVVAARPRHYIDLNFGVKCGTSGSKKIPVEALVLNKISQRLPNTFIQNDSRWTHLQKLKLADPNYNIPGDIDLLLAGDVWDDIVLRGLYKSRKGSPVAQNTRLGWILNGKIHQQSQEISIFTIQIDENESNETINQQLQKFWEVEEVNSTISDPSTPVTFDSSVMMNKCE